jgi:hypothetical protein
MCCSRVTAVAPRGETLVTNDKRPERWPPGASRFSTLFYVAAIGGKSPRVFDCVRTLAGTASDVKAAGVAADTLVIPAKAGISGIVKRRSRLSPG